MTAKRVLTHKVWLLAGSAAALAGLAFLLAWVSNRYQSAAGWPGFLLAEAISLGFAWVGYQIVRREKVPRWLVGLTAGAILLRLAVGVFWVAALPVWGYPNEVQQAGYVMFDPFLRDQDAWRLAQSGESLVAAFGDYSPHDQYGGLLFLSALMYRFLGGEVHQPLLIIVLTSVVSGMAPLFAWGFLRRLSWNRAAPLVTWGVALYPEAVLLGSSQMRGAFTIPLGAAIGFLMLRFIQERQKKDLLWMGALAGIMAGLTWAYLLQLVVILGLLLVGILRADWKWEKLSRWMKVSLAGSGVFLILVSGYLWKSLSSMSSFQRYLTVNASGIVQVMLKRMPEFLQIPFVVSYGVVRPLLPAAITEFGTSVLWRWVAIWRAAGWTILLTLLVYATLTVIRKRQWLKPAGMLMWGNWLMILVSSFRAGGDQWDNPRYRAGFIVFQLVLAGWALAQHQTDRDALFRRVVSLALALEAWVFIWYAARYYDVPWGTKPVESKIIYGLLTGLGLWLLDWLWVRWKEKSRNA